MSSTSGGRRPGAGRPKLGAQAATEFIVVRLSPDHKKLFRALGGAPWLRRLLDKRATKTTGAK